MPNKCAPTEPSLWSSGSSNIDVTDWMASDMSDVFIYSVATAKSTRSVRKLFTGVMMEAFDDRPVFVHCAANKRVSAFVFLFLSVVSAHRPPRSGARLARDLAARSGVGAFH
jgi:hypothetical protein